MSEPRFLDGRTALVTGGSRNLGPVLAARLADAGATVAVHYRSARAEAEAVAEELRRRTGRAHVAVGGDLQASADVDRVVDAAREALGGHVDVFVHNAGPMLSMTPVAELDPGEWDATWETNVRAAYLAVRRLAPGMRERGFGRVVLLSAGSAFVRNHGAYGLAKAAIIPLTEELAAGLGPEITVNAVAPGQILESAADIAQFDDTFVERTTAATPGGRLVTREEVAEVVAALCSPPFALVTGATIPIDGGARLPRF